MVKDLKTFLDFSNILADEARLISLKYFKKKIKTENKKNNTSRLKTRISENVH